MIPHKPLRKGRLLTLPTTSSSTPAVPGRAARHKAKPHGPQPMGTPQTSSLLSRSFPQRTVTIFQVPCSPAPRIPSWSVPSCLLLLEVGWVTQPAFCPCQKNTKIPLAPHPLDLPVPPFPPSTAAKSWEVSSAVTLSSRWGPRLLGRPRGGIYMALPRYAPKHALCKETAHILASSLHSL